MREDDIQQLLQEADQLSLPLTDPVTVANHVRRQVRRRKRRKRNASALAAVIVLGGGITFLLRSEISKVNQIPNEIFRLQARVAQLEAQAKTQTAMIEVLLVRQEQRERLATLERRLAELGDPLAALEAEIEEAAFVSYYQAKRKLEELNLKASAIQDFEAVIMAFPDTHWATEAKKRLQEIERNEKGVIHESAKNNPVV